MTKVLFVCSGNTCRSPMAEAILASKRLPGIEVRSAGVFAFDGADLSPQAGHVLADNQIDFQHKATLLQAEDVDWADLILTMTESHKTFIHQQFPHAADKVHTLKEYVGEESKDVADPFGGSVSVYEETFAELKQLIEKLILILNPNV